MLVITLSKAPLDNKDIGYQDPIPDNEVSEYQDDSEFRRRRQRS
jgi:hypothetical protein